MSDIAIRAEHIGKKFRIGAYKKNQNFREAIRDAFQDPFLRVAKFLRGQAKIAAELDETIWALKDVSFEIRKGEAVGIIGRNGAGKSTMLKVLSRITEPTSGYAEVHGRVGSLLEVGTGFHQELTGRENIYLNGAILGMKQYDIKRKFDEIVDFSEIEKFVDTPVKHYSSGMYLRLAFAVAAHLEPDTLLVDEVLAVGDIGFQRKCLGRMNEVAKEGRTVLFVSHNMGAIANLCKSAIWFNDGQIVAEGPARETINAYIKDSAKINKANINLRKQECTGEVAITDVRLFDSNNEGVDIFAMGETINVEVDVECSRIFSSLYLTMEIRRIDLGLRVLHMTNHDCGYYPTNVSAGMHTFLVKLPNCMLYPASYSISFWVGTDGSKTNLDCVIDVVSFSMVQSEVTKRTTPLSMQKEAVFYIPTMWSERKKES